MGKDKVEDARESGAVSRSASAESGQGGAGGFGKCWAKVREEDQETGDLMSGSLIDKGREEGGRGGEGDWGIGMVGGVSLEATEQRALIAWMEKQRARAATGRLARDRCPLQHSLALCNTLWPVYCPYSVVYSTVVCIRVL